VLFETNIAVPETAGEQRCGGTAITLPLASATNSATVMMNNTASAFIGHTARPSNWSMIILAVAAVAEGLRAAPRHRETGGAGPVGVAVNRFLTIWVRD
jgi:hypothetical protein